MCPLNSFIYWDMRVCTDTDALYRLLVNYWNVVCLHKFRQRKTRQQHAGIEWAYFTLSAIEEANWNMANYWACPPTILSDVFICSSEINNSLDVSTRNSQCSTQISFRKVVKLKKCLQFACEATTSMRWYPIHAMSCSNVDDTLNNKNAAWNSQYGSRTMTSGEKNKDTRIPHGNKLSWIK